MRELRYTLVSDGSSDRALLKVLSWLLREHGVSCPIQPAWADLRLLRYPPKDLAGRIEQSLELYPCDLLFVHRDAEHLPYARRKEEIRKALALVPAARSLSVCVVPVRMLEAWLLIDEAALRRAAGNPNGRILLKLPSPTELERCTDPKNVLHQLLKEASELRGRRLWNLRVEHCAHRVTEYTDDFSPLRALSAFQYLEVDIAETIAANHWEQVP